MNSSDIRYRFARRTPFFYGWAILFSAGAAVFVRNASAALTLAVFMVPMSEDLGWSRTLLAGSASAGGIAAMFASPLSGYLVDRFGPRVVLAGSAVVLGFSTMAIGWWVTPISFYVFFGIGRVIFGAPVQIGAGTVVSQWFVRRRGRANGILGSTHSVGMGLMPLFAQVLINTVGWREAWFWLGISVWVIALAPIWLLMISRPEDIGMKPDGDGDLARSDLRAGTGERPQAAMSTESEGWTLRDAMRTPALWILGFSGGLMFFVHASVNIHQAAFLRDQGIDATVAAAALTSLAAGAVVGSLFWGMLAERFPVRFTYAAVALFMAIVSLLFLAVDSTPKAFLVATLFGFGLGGLLVVPSIAVADYFGRRSLGAVRGFIEPWVGGGQAAGALGAGLIFDFTGDYRAVFPLLTVLGVLAAVLIVVTPAPGRPPVRTPAVTDPVTADD
ncbi:MAG: MFS transporter [Chloroflexi bacterium]|nr:MFS transporter [Chloroflexota bacterium]